MKDVEILGYQIVRFAKDSKFWPLYENTVNYWDIKCGPVAASLFYDLGRIHGIREERARKKAGA